MSSETSNAVVANREYEAQHFCQISDTVGRPLQTHFYGKIPQEGDAVELICVSNEGGVVKLMLCVKPSLGA